MDAERSLRRLQNALEPSRGAKERIRARMLTQIDTHPLLDRAKELATPSPGLRQTIWARILERIEPVEVSSLLDQLRNLLSPSADRSLARGGLRLAPVPVQSRYQRAIKWTAAVAVLLIVIRATPILFLAAPPSSAESAVLLIPTRGEVTVAVGGLWEPVTSELRLTQGGSFQTQEGEGTFILNDDGNIRVDRGTMIHLHDITNRPDPALKGPTLSLVQGRVWVQGFVPDSIRGIILSTPRGDITVHEGSVSVAAGDIVDVRIWDRHALVEGPDGNTVFLVAGERMELREGGVSYVKKIAARDYEDPWAAQNLERDAVHRREIAQLQRERAAARAGILPTSPLYPVKRVAEAVDALLTFDQQTKLEKQLQHASTRLSEAAAILASGGTGATATAALEEYRMTLVAVASGSGDSVTQFLVRQQLAEDTAELSAALPDDELYEVKMTVLEASAEIPGGPVEDQQVESVVFLDTLDTAQEAVLAGDLDRAREAFAQVQTYLDTIQSGSDVISDDMRKEAMSLLSSLAVALQQNAGSGDTLLVGRDLLKEVNAYLPQTIVERAPISEEQAEAIVQGIYDRVFFYKLPRSRWSQLMYEMKQLRGHPDQGTLLRHLYRKLPEQGLAQYVRTAIVELGEEKAAEQ